MTSEKIQQFKKYIFLLKIKHSVTTRTLVIVILLVMYIHTISTINTFKNNNKEKNFKK